MTGTEHDALLPTTTPSSSTAAAAETALLGYSPPLTTRIDRWRSHSQGYLASKEKHYLILVLVSLDVVAILTEIMVSLVTCEDGTKDESWVATLMEVVKVCGVVFSSLFLVELLASIWAFGWGFFNTWFHCFDAFVILVSFVVDVLAHGVVEEIASLVIILRLWRMVKIVEEMSVGASEQMEELEAQVEKLEQEKTELEKEKDALALRVQALEATA